jgi:hypothetical protein
METSDLCFVVIVVVATIGSREFSEDNSRSAGQKITHGDQPVAEASTYTGRHNV